MGSHCQGASGQFVFFPIEKTTRLPEKNWKDFRSCGIIKKGKMCVWGAVEFSLSFL